MSHLVSSTVVDKLNLIISFSYYDPLLSITSYRLTKAQYLFADYPTWDSQPFDAVRSSRSGLLTQYQIRLIWGEQVSRLNLQSENMLFWVKYL